METKTKGYASQLRAGEKPTLKTISRISGLAVPTVSRALSDAPDIKQDTKVLIRQIAKEIGYVPNRAGVRLRTGRTNVISLVLSTENDAMNHTAKLISSLSDALSDTPLHLIVTTYQPDEDPMNPIRYLVETKSADAVILNQTTPDDPRITYLQKNKMPFACHGRSEHAQAYPYFDFDNEGFGYLGIEKLHTLGRTEIVMLAPPKEHSYAMHMTKGALRAAEKFGVSLTIFDDISSDDGTVAVREKLATKLSSGLSFDGIMCGSTSSAIGAVVALEDHGKVVGTDFDVIGKEAMPFLTLFRREIIAMQEDVGEAGAFLAKAALAAIREPDAPPLQKLDVPTREGIGL